MLHCSPWSWCVTPTWFSIISIMDRCKLGLWPSIFLLSLMYGKMISQRDPVLAVLLKSNVHWKIELRKMCLRLIPGSSPAVFQKCTCENIRLSPRLFICCSTWIHANLFSDSPLVLSVITDSKRQLSYNQHPVADCATSPRLITELITWRRWTSLHVRPEGGVSEGNWWAAC